MWKTVADFLDYDIYTIKIIGEKRNNDCEKCCEALFEDWLCTVHGVAPKTWTTLIASLKEIKFLALSVCEIEDDLYDFILNSSLSSSKDMHENENDIQPYLHHGMH